MGYVIVPSIALKQKNFYIRLNNYTTDVRPHYGCHVNQVYLPGICSNIFQSIVPESYLCTMGNDSDNL